MNVRRLIFLANIFAILAVIFLPALVFAQTPEAFTGLEFATETGLGTRDIRSIVGSIINVLMGFLGVIAVVIILIGGFKWMTAGGNEDKVTEAKKLIMSGIIGLAIVLAAYSIATFVVMGLINATT